LGHETLGCSIDLYCRTVPVVVRINMMKDCFE
jgi:hypothetical protein